MRRSVFIARTGLAVALMSSATAFSNSSFADIAAASGGANGTVSATATNSAPAGTTASQGNVSLATGSQASENGQNQGTASTNSTATAAAGAAAGIGSISLTMASGADTSVASTSTTKNAAANASASGSIGPAQLGVLAQAHASSGPGQLTATASASDGSFALAKLGVVNDLKTSVPGGVTQLLQKNSGTESISCNAAGTCSHANVSNNSVSAGIKIFANTGTVTAGTAEAMLSAFLSAEANASSIAVGASASSTISGTGTSSGHGYSASVSANIGSWGSSGSWRATSIDGTTFGTTVGTISARVWVEGEKMCASTQVHLRHGRHAMKTIVKCKRVKTEKRSAFQKTTTRNWLSNLFESRPKSRKWLTNG